MATLASSGAAGGINPKNYRADQGFYLALSVALSLLIVVGFAQLALRGITDPVGAPVRVHIHALLLLAWIGILLLQNWLAYRGTLALHRKLGWTAMLLVAAIVVANYYVTIMAIVDDRMLPGETPPHFLSLGTADTLTFAGLVGWAVWSKRDTQWHRRLMFGATLLLSAAAMNRLLVPMPPAPQFALSLVGQLAFVAALAWNDRRVLGRVHPATVAVAVTVVCQRFLPFVLAEFPPMADLANSFAG